MKALCSLQSRMLAAAICAVFFLIPAKVPAQDSPGKLTLAQEKAIDLAIAKQMQRQQAVGLAVGVLRNRKTVYLKAYGLADRERGVPATTKTVINWASNSKPLVAILVMMLFGQGKLDLDDEVSKYVPEFPEKRRTIKVRHLLCHQSGIPHYGPDIKGVDRKYSVRLPFTDPIIALDRFSKSPVKFAPGDKVLYSTFAYVLASAVVQRAGKQPISEQIRQKIAQPLGLTSLQLDTPYDRQAHWAIGYQRDKYGRIVRTEEYAHYWKHGGGAYKSNIEDFAKWAEALLQRKLVSKELESVMWQPQKTNDGKITRFGLGFGVQIKDGRLKVSHNGGQPETKTRLVLYPEEGHGVVVMCNCSHTDPTRFSNAVFKALQTK